MRFDPSGMNRAFDRMQKTAKDKGRDLATDQGNFFMSVAKKLGWEAAPSRDELDTVFQQLKGRLKRKPGVSPMQELQRRKRARGTFARGWHISKVQNLGNKIRLWITNESNQSALVDTSKHTASSAANLVGGRFKSKLNKLAEQATGVF